MFCRNLSRKNKNDPERLALHYKSAIGRDDRNTNANVIYKTTKFETENGMNKVSHVSKTGVGRNLQRKTMMVLKVLLLMVKTLLGMSLGTQTLTKLTKGTCWNRKAHK